MNCVSQASVPHLHCESYLTVQAFVGVYEWERKADRPLVLCLQLGSTQPLNLTRILIERRLQVWLAPCRYRLLEALAEHLTQCMFIEWNCSRIVLEIEKPGALGDWVRVGVRISRHADRSRGG